MMKFNQLMTSSICAALLLLVFSFVIQAKPGDLDTTFGNGGIARTIFPNQPGGFCLSVVADSALQSDGKIVVAGYLQYVCTDGGQTAPMLARYNTDGTLDAGFGSGGIVTTRFSLPNGGSETGYFNAVVIQPDGKIIAAGYTQVNTTSVFFGDVVMARYNTDGTLDSTFGNGGKVFTNTGPGSGFYSNGNVVINNLAIAPDGSIYAVGGGGFANDGGANFNRDSIVIKYAPNGSFINSRRFSFQSNDLVTEIAIQAKLQSDGKLIFSIINDANISHFMLLRINSDLTSDTSFGANGVVITDFGTGVEQAAGINIDPDGKITVSGNSASNNGTGNFYAARYNPNGSLDSTFGSGGKVIVLVSDSPFPGADKEGQRIVRQPDGKYISAFGARFGNFGAIRLLPNGSLDPSFGVGGVAHYATHDGSSPYPTILGYGGLILLQPDGKILLPGTEQVSGGDFRPIGIKILRLTNEATSNANPVIVSGQVTDGNGNALKNILVSLSGVQGQSARTDANGNYTFSNLAIGSYTITPFDANLNFTPANRTLDLSTNQTNISFAAAISANPVPTPTPSDDFSGNQRDPNRWQLGTLTTSPFNPFVTVVQQNGQLVITPVSNAAGFNGYISKPFDFTNGTGSLEVVKVADTGAQTIFAIGSGGDNYYRFVAGSSANPTVAELLKEARVEPFADTTFLVFQVKQGSNVKTIAIPYDPVAHRFWRFRHDQTVTNDFPNGAVVFETSPENVTYTERFRAEIQKPINALQTEISAGTTQAVSNPGQAVFDNYQLTLNDIDNASFYVGQQYRDFLNRQPDISGLQFWTNEVFGCGADAKCIDIKRQNVSAAFFVSIEFQQTGFLVYKLFKASFGNIAGKPVPVRFANFLPDVQSIGSGVIVGQTGYEAKLEANKVSFINAFVNRSTFKTAFPDTLTNAQYVDQLNTNTGNALSQIERTSLVNGLNAGTETRATVLRKVAENQAFTTSEFNRAFVLMQYFGYLRRDPDSGPDTDFGGYFFWLNKLTSFNGDYIRSEMVRSFTISTEYRKRFGKP